MSKRNKAYRHTARFTGTGEAMGEDAATEHRDTAAGNAGERNELTPDERGRGDGYGPRPHDDTRTTRKGE